MFDIDRLMCIYNEADEAERDYREKCREVHAEKEIPSCDTIWIPSLDGSTAYRLGELSERSSQKWRELADICVILDLDQELLIAVTKSIRRWEKNHGRYGRLLRVSKNNYVGICLQQYLRHQNDGQFYKSTGRRKAWCPAKKEN